MAETGTALPKGPLSGLRILEMGHFIAAPFCTRILGDLGAEIIKVESPGAGDPVRTWGRRVDGKSVWWSVHGRNKKSVTLNLKNPKGVAVARKLIGEVDAVVENYRPGQLERWGLGDAVIEDLNPGCIVVHVSGYGQTGPGRDRAAFGVIGEAVGGLRHLTGYPDGMSPLPPSRTGVSLGDMVAGMYAAIGLLSALYDRQARNATKGRSVDVALTEAVFSLLEGCLPEYGLLGEVRAPAGGALPVSAPSNAYPSADGRWVIIAANSDALYRRLMQVINRPDIAADENFKTNPGRVARMAELDEAIGQWTRTLPAKQAEQILAEADIPSTLIYTIEDCAADPQFLARDMIVPVNDPNFGETLHPGIIPKMSGADPGGITWSGPDVGAHTDSVLAELLHMSREEIEILRTEGAL
ncbi:MAG: CoA transferase [Rhodospirillales bacterium]|nr:CoA transferase [Rhodospirillales bacterium]